LQDIYYINSTTTTLINKLMGQQQIWYHGCDYQSYITKEVQYACMFDLVPH